jgi:hypothetical protein
MELVIIAISGDIGLDYFFSIFANFTFVMVGSIAALSMFVH